MKKTLILTTIACAAAASGALAQDVEINRAQLGMFGVMPEEFVPAGMELSQEKIDLGRMLFYESRISKSHQFSCNSCHNLETYGVDNKQFSDGHAGHKTGRNSPTVYNAAHHIAQFWDGRAMDVEEQAKGPVLAAGEMGMPSEEFVVNVLRSIPGYDELFRKAFPGQENPVNFNNMALAIGAFERKLVTPTRFHAYVGGDEDALGPEEKKGLATFLAVGCTTCHLGPTVGGMLYQKLGLVKPWPELTDRGRAEVTGNSAEEYFFKVPSLLNIAETGPYLHDGTIDDLGQMVSMMAEHQLGKMLTEQEVKDIVTFLESLTGEIPKDYIKKPELPESGPETPKPAFD